MIEVCKFCGQETPARELLTYHGACEDCAASAWPTSRTPVSRLVEPSRPKHNGQPMDKGKSLWK